MAIEFFIIIAEKTQILPQILPQIMAGLHGRSGVLFQSVSQSKSPFRRAGNLLRGSGGRVRHDSDAKDYRSFLAKFYEKVHSV